MIIRAKENQLRLPCLQVKLFGKMVISTLDFEQIWHENPIEETIWKVNNLY